MNIKLDDKKLTQIEKDEITKLLKRKNRNIINNLEQMWFLMDLVWNDYNCDNKNLNWKNIGKFYSHPVWLLNGLFIEQDKESMGHRDAISDWVVQHKFCKVVDYGGGFGTLARLIAEKESSINMNIFEPHPSEYGLKRANEFANITIIDKLGLNNDCLVSTDVLEHVPFPLKDFENMIDSVNHMGYLVIANAFYPQIHCHLPSGFHLRYTFSIFAFMMGLKKIGILDGSHATIYQKVGAKRFNHASIVIVEKISKVMYPILNFLHPYIKTIIGKK